MKQVQSGYILVLTMIILSLMMILITQLFERGTTHLNFTKTIIEREKAKRLAIGAINLAISHLTINKKSEEKNQEDNNQEDNKKLLLEKILPTLNQWQTYILKKDIDGIDGKIKICVSCEEGKINLNKFFNFKEKKFLEEEKKITKTLLDSLGKIINKPNAMELLEKYLKNRKYELNDPTELIKIKDLKYFANKLFYTPPSLNKKGEKKNKKIYLTDIFTIWNENGKLEPWLLSNSLCILFDLKNAADMSVKSRQNSIKDWMKNFSKTEVDWKKDWNKILKPVYEKDLKSMPKNIDLLFSKNFNPQIFSVRISSKVGRIKQEIFAILKKNENNFTIEKIYWI